MKNLIANTELIKNQAFINGKWVHSLSGKEFRVTNPYDGKFLLSVADCGPEDTYDAINSAELAFKSWKVVSAKKRSLLLKKWYELITINREDLAKMITLEQGKPIREARNEVDYGASFIEWFAEEARRVYGDTVPGHQVNKRIIIIKEPVGVVAAITPWNFPMAMITRKVAPALAVGCTVVIKPAEDTPLVALALARLAEEAGFPPGVINVIPTSDPAGVGRVLTESKKVKKLSFTGSTITGKKLMKQCSDTVKKLSLELGGNAPFIVFKDADINAAVEGAISSKFRNAGQTCVCANRIYVQTEVYEEFMKLYLSEVKKLKVGSGLDDEVAIGPLINKRALEKVRTLVSDALKKGGDLKTGGEPASKNKNLYPPTVISGATSNMDLSKDEIFGPVAPIFKFQSVEEVIQLANNTEVGLAAYFYGGDNSLIWQVAEALEYGMIGINTGMISTEVAPFGGIKESGFGREGSKYGIEEYLNVKYLCMEV
ncbi:MAG: NAD-dependent succinate-semialdehyde dehydrogenase [Bacteroidota bacterium]